MRLQKECKIVGITLKLLLILSIRRVNQVYIFDGLLIWHRECLKSLSSKEKQPIILLRNFIMLKAFITNYDSLKKMTCLHFSVKSSNWEVTLSLLYCEYFRLRFVYLVNIFARPGPKQPENVTRVEKTLPQNKHNRNGLERSFDWYIIITPRKQESGVPYQFTTRHKTKSRRKK